MNLNLMKYFLSSINFEYMYVKFSDDEDDYEVNDEHTSAVQEGTHETCDIPIDPEGDISENIDENRSGRNEHGMY